jgi:hypothetical protein
MMGLLRGLWHLVTCPGHAGREVYGGGCRKHRRRR